MPVAQMTAIGIAGNIVDVGKLKRELEQALRETNDEVDSDYHQFYDTWEHDKPSMESKVYQRGGDLIGEVATDGDSPGNQKLAWLDEGVPPHDIHSKGGTPMRFRAGFGPKTARRRIRSTSGRKADGDWTSTHHVKHPGIAPREISDEIAKTQEPSFTERIQSAIDRST